MYHSIAKKQNYIYAILILLTTVASIIIYHQTNSRWILLNAANKKYFNKEFTEAIPLYKKSLEDGETSPRLLVHLANSYVATSQYAEGIHWYKAYLAKFPDDDIVRLELARALSWNGDLKESEMEYKKLLERKK